MNAFRYVVISQTTYAALHDVTCAGAGAETRSRNNLELYPVYRKKPDLKTLLINIIL